MSDPVRVRFAPSPTGPLHIGGVRTALYNYLFARKHGGSFVLRIEDTDQSRYVPGAESYIVNALEWLNIPFDEGPDRAGGYGPYRQSERKHLYKAYAEKLVAHGHAYYAFDTSEALDAHRKDHESKGKTFIYNWHNRNKLDNSLNLSEEALQKRLQSGEDYVIRFYTPESELLQMHDIIRGGIQVDTGTLDDKVLFKSDGMPTYHLANIVDDHLMEISHVIRGEEWLPSLALHVLLYRAFDWKAPKFAHLPLIMKPEGKGKLSKRDGDKLGFPVFPLAWTGADGEQFAGYREDGYLPEAVVNMLAFLGWNPGTEQEIFDLKELIDAFELERVHKSGAKFDPEKTKWYQHHYFQHVDDALLTAMFQKYLEDKEVAIAGRDIGRIVHVLKERATFVSDLWDQGSFFFIPPKHFDEKVAAKAFKPGSKDILQEVFRILDKTDEFNAAVLADCIKGWIQKQELGFGKVMMPLRLALVGEMKGPDVFDIIAILGKKESLSRLTYAMQCLA